MKLTIGLLFAMALVAMPITIEANRSGGPLTSITTGTFGRFEEDWNYTRLRLLIECSECILDGIDFNDIFEECKDKDDIWASFECAKEAMKKSGVVGSCGECAANVIDDAIEALDEVDKSEEN